MVEVAELRVLVPGDEARLFEFLGARLETSLFFFSNIERAGLVDRGERYQGTYVARFDASGAITAVAGHSWSGFVLLQGDAGLEQAAARALEVSGRSLRGLVGPWSLVCRVRQSLGFSAAVAAHDGRDLLYSLSLDALRRPELLARPDVVLREPTPEETTGLVGAWRAEYHVELLGAPRTSALEQQGRREAADWRASGLLWVLTVGGELVAMTGFNAQARGVAQVGGVFTPPALRGRGYARAAVAASLELARGRGVTRSILFTGETNQAAQRAYLALGYDVIGDFGLLLF
jgi:RimJ/RimL family protein N-acetyltransferase